MEQHKPDLLFVTEELEQGYGIGLVREVERLHPATRTMIFSVGKIHWWLRKPWKPEPMV